MRLYQLLVCMHACMHTYVHTCVFGVCAYVRTCVFGVCAYVRTCVFGVCAYVRTCVFGVCMHTYVHVCVCYLFYGEHRLCTYNQCPPDTPASPISRSLQDDFLVGWMFKYRYIRASYRIFSWGGGGGTFFYCRETMWLIDHSEGGGYRRGMFLLPCRAA